MLVPRVQRQTDNYQKFPLRVAILGSTGSIGVAALRVIERYPECFQVCALVAHSNAELLGEQVEKWRPAVVGLADASKAEELMRRIRGTGIELVAGPHAAEQIARAAQADVVLAAMVGSVGLAPVLAALERGLRVALANKESLVAGGALVARALHAHGGEIIPVDSEHAAIFQALQGVGEAEVGRLILTASGGPFLRYTPESLAHVTPEEAVRHPRWNMGAKISVDSATLVNKALEVIEAHWLFAQPSERIEVVIHPQSIVHSVIELVDGTQLAQMSVPDMSAPIAAALSYPKRLVSVVQRLELAGVGTLQFEPVNHEQFPALRWGRAALEAGGGATAVFNAANEQAVRLFLDRKISFSKIVPVVAQALDEWGGARADSLPELLELEREVGAKVVREVEEKGS